MKNIKHKIRVCVRLIVSLLLLTAIFSISSKSKVIEEDGLHNLGTTTVSTLSVVLEENSAMDSDGNFSVDLIVYNPEGLYFCALEGNLIINDELFGPNSGITLESEVRHEMIGSLATDAIRHGQFNYYYDDYEDRNASEVLLTTYTFKVKRGFTEDIRLNFSYMAVLSVEGDAYSPETDDCNVIGINIVNVKVEEEGLRLVIEQIGEMNSNGEFSIAIILYNPQGLYFYAVSADFIVDGELFNTDSKITYINETKGSGLAGSLNVKDQYGLLDYFYSNGVDRNIGVLQLTTLNFKAKNVNGGDINLTLDNIIVESETMEKYKSSNGDCNTNSIIIEGKAEEVNEYTVDFNSKEGSIVSSITKTSGEVIATSPTSTRTGYTFIGWYKEETYENKVDFPYTVTENIILYAKWEETKTYNVNFVTNEGSSISPIKTSKIASMPVSTRTGYELVGWYTEEGFINEITYPYEVTKDTILYAKWEKIEEDHEYTITFNTNGGSSVSSIKTATLDESPETTRPGYIFLGWYLESSFNTKVNFPYQVTSNKTLYAKWECIYDVENFTLVFEMVSEIDEDGYFTVALVLYNPSGRSFSYIESMLYINGVKFNSNSCITKISEIVSSEYQGQLGTGQYNFANLDYIFNEDEELTDVRKVITTITFKVKKGTPAGTITIGFEDSGDSYVAEDWAPAEVDLEELTITIPELIYNYTVTFDTDGGSNVSAITDVSIPTSPVTTKTGYIFLGWYLESNFKNEVLFPYTLVDDITLYAKWEKEDAIKIAFEVETTNITSKTFDLVLKLYNPGHKKINLIDFELALDERLKVIGYSSYQFDSGNYGVNIIDPNYCIMLMNSLSGYIDGNEVIIFIFKIQVTENGIYEAGISMDGLYSVDNKQIEITDISFEELILNINLEENPSLSDDLEIKEIHIDDVLSNITAIDKVYTLPNVSVNTETLTLGITVNNKSQVKINNNPFELGVTMETIDLVYGLNQIKITVLSEAGNVETYIIKVTRNEEEITEKVELEIALKDNITYDTYYLGEIGIDFYLNNVTYNIGTASIAFTYDTSILEYSRIASNYTILNNNLFGEERTIDLQLNTNTDGIKLFTIYFKLKENITHENHQIEIASTEYLSVEDISSRKKEIVGDALAFTINAGKNPVLTNVKVTKENQSSNIIYQYNGDGLNTNGYEMIVPELDYSMDRVSLYLTGATYSEITINGNPYVSPYSVVVPVDEAVELLIVVGFGDSTSTKEYTIILTRNSGDSTNTLDEVKVNNEVATLNNDIYTIENKIAYLDRNNVTVYVTKTSNLSTVKINGFETNSLLLTNLEIGSNEITITVTSQNGIVETYALIIEVEGKLLLTITDVSDISKNFDGTVVDEATFKVKEGNTVINNPTYTFKYYDLLDNEISAPRNVGSYKFIISVSKTTNYDANTYEGTFTISSTVITDENLTIDVSPTTFIYDGTAKTLTTITVKLNGVTLILDTDYEILKYEDNTDAGTAKVYIRGLDNISGTKSKDFTINKADITLTISFEALSVIYGTDPSITVTGNSGAGNLTYYYSTSINGSWILGLPRSVGTFYIKASVDETLNYNEGNVVSEKITITAFNINDAISSISITTTPYTGTAVTPQVTLKAMIYGVETILAVDSDYMVGYEDNIIAGTGKVKLAGTGNYTGTKTMEFTIEKDSINPTISDLSSSVVYGTDPTMTLNGNSGNGEVTYYHSTTPTGPWTLGLPRSVGTFYIMIAIAETDNYEAGTVVSETTVIVTEFNLSDATMSISATSYTYTGKAYEPKITLTATIYGEVVTLIISTDYNESYEENIGAGIGKANVLGNGNYTGTNSKDFTINKKDLGELTTDSIPTQTFNGQAITVDALLKVIYGDLTLTKGTDYVIEKYEDNTLVGTAKIYLAATENGNYTGTLVVEFSIQKNNDTSKVAIIVEVGPFVYNGRKFEPSITVELNGVEIDSKLYSVSYEDNTDAGKGKIIVESLYFECDIEEFMIEPKSITDEDITITEILPQTYSGSAITPSFIIYDETTKLLSPDSYTYEITKNVNAGTGIITIKGEGNYKDEREITFTISKLKMTDSNTVITLEYDSVKFDGTQKKPAVTKVVCNGIPLLLSDYEIEYSQNTNASNEATVTIIPKLNKDTNDYNLEGSRSKTFTIEQIDITDEDIEVTIDQDTFIYDGLEHKPVVTVKIKSTNFIIASTDYTVNYELDVINHGTKYITVTGNNINLTSVSTSISYEIEQVELTLAMLTSGKIPNQKYTGEAITVDPLIVFEYAGMTLVKDVDYTLTYSNNTEGPRATITLLGIGNYYTEEGLILNFDIIERPIDQNVTVTIDKDSFVYNGQVQKPIVTVKVNGTEIYEPDYSIEWSNDLVNKGEKTITVIIENYEGISGNTNVYYNITSKDINSEDITISEILNQTYTGSEISPEFTITDNSIAELAEGLLKDYTYKISSNTNVGLVTITIKGEGNYNGERTIDFNIIPLEIDNTNTTIELDEYEFDYDTLSKNPLVIKVSGQTFILNSNDYIVTITNNTKAGIGTVKITPKEISEGVSNITGWASVDFTINKVNIEDLDITLDYDSTTYDKTAKEPGVTVKIGENLVSSTEYKVTYTLNTKAGRAEVTISELDEVGNLVGSRTLYFTILERNINDKDITISTIADQTYTGEDITVDDLIDIIYGNYHLVLNTDYYIEEYLNNISGYVATIKIVGQGNYTGTYDLNFNIVDRPIDKFVSITIENDTLIYNGKGQRPVITVVIDGQLLSEFEYSTSDNVVDITNVGPKSIRVIIDTLGIDSYEDIDYSIIAKDLDSSMIISNEVENQTYTGESILIGSYLEIKYEGMTLVEGTDFEIVYVDGNITPGTLVFNIKGLGNYSDEIYCGTFEIVKATIEDITNEIIVTFENDELPYMKANLYAKELVYLNGVLLDSDDYTILYPSDLKTIGKKTIEIILKYVVVSETITADYYIVENDIDSNDIFNALIEGQYYVGKSITVDELIELYIKYYILGEYDSDILLEKYDGTNASTCDYEIGTYSLNDKVGTASIEIIGKNNFYGTKTITFQILESQTIEVKSNAPFKYVRVVYDEENLIYTYISTTHVINDYLDGVFLTNVRSQMTIKQFLSLIVNNIAQINVYDEEEQLIDSNSYEYIFIATGYKIELVIEGIAIDSIIVSILGDVNSDGIIDSSDCSSLLRAINGRTSFDLARILAGDINEDGILDGDDYTPLLRQVNGRTNFEDEYQVSFEEALFRSMAMNFVSEENETIVYEEIQNVEISSNDIFEEEITVIKAYETEEIKLFIRREEVVYYLERKAEE